MTSRDPDGSRDRPVPEDDHPRAGSPAPPEPLPQGTLWRIRTASGPDGQPRPIPEDVEATLRFEAGRVAGTGGCNRFSAECRIDGQRLEIGPIASTMMACPDPAMAAEARVFAALGAVSSWAIEAIARAQLGSDAQQRLDLPIRSGVSMRFSSHWAEVAAAKAAEEEARRAAEDDSATAADAE